MILSPGTNGIYALLVGHDQDNIGTILRHGYLGIVGDGLISDGLMGDGLMGDGPWRIKTDMFVAAYNVFVFNGYVVIMLD
jgi:hypothetical protein